MDGHPSFDGLAEALTHDLIKILWWQSHAGADAADIFWADDMARWQILNKIQRSPEHFAAYFGLLALEARFP